MVSTTDIIYAEKRIEGAAEQIDSLVSAETEALKGIRFQVSKGIPVGDLELRTIQLISPKEKVPMNGNYAAAPEGYKAFQVGNEPLKPERSY